MIITVQKPFDEVMKNLKPFGSVFVIGCAACATKCQTGGEDAVKKMIGELKTLDKTVSGYAVLDTPCDMRIVKKDLGHSKEAQSAEVLVVLACGAGVQAIETVLGKTIIPGLNPVFIGTTERIGNYREFCSACGDCIIDQTAGICPVTRCAKGLLNGPCGGTIEGKCETDLDQDCVWALIYEKLKKQGKEKDMVRIVFSPRNTLKPRSLRTKEAGKRQKIDGKIFTDCPDKYG